MEITFHEVGSEERVKINARPTFKCGIRAGLFHTRQSVDLRQVFKRQRWVNDLQHERGTLYWTLLCFFHYHLLGLELYSLQKLAIPES